MRIGHRILSGTMAFILACSMALSATCPVMASGNEPVLTNTESGEKSLEDLIREASESEQDEAINEGTGHTDDDYDWMTESDDYAQGTEGGYPETAPTLYAFDAETVIDGLKVHVTAPEGVFPEGSSLYVGYAQYDTGETQNLAMEYALDISILASGKPVEPAAEMTFRILLKDMGAISDRELVKIVRFDDKSLHLSRFGLRRLCLGRFDFRGLCLRGSRRCRCR